MKFGVHLALWMKRWEDDVVPYIEEAARIGFDGVELSLLGMTEANIARIRRALDETGLELTCTTGLGLDSDVSSEDAEVRRAGQAYLAWAVETASALGGSLLSGVLYAPWGERVAERREERWQRSVEALRQVAPLAEVNGVTLGLEAINRYETDLVTTAALATRMAEEIAHPNVGVLLDTYHMNIEERNIAKALHATGDRLVHLHIVENDRGVPGSGHIPWGSVTEALKRLPYRGWATLEMFVQPDLAVSSDLAIWRPIEPDPSEAARRGLAFLRERLS